MMDALAPSAGDGLAPAEEAEIAAAVADAHRAGEPLLVMGRGTKMGMLRPVQAARGLSTRNHAGVTMYSPNELVISARAGTPLPEVEAALAERGQMIIAEPPDLSGLMGEGVQTVGGIVATNLSGPRRVGTGGAVRDQVMGVRAVNGEGEVIRSGGRVLKNVTGLDLAKLLTGSHGTLGVLTEITLKVLPRPESSGSLVLPGVDAAQGVAALSAALGSPYGVTGAAWLPAGAAAAVPALAAFGGPVALLRIEEFAPSVRYRLGKLREELAAWGRGEVLDDEASQAAWRAVRDAVPLRAEPEEAVWRLSVRPSAGPGTVQALDAAGVRSYLDWGGGLVWAVGPASGGAHEAVSAAAAAAGGVWTVMRAPEPLRAAIHVVPPEPEALARITRRVKAAMDPKGILNPGRLYAGV